MILNGLGFLSAPLYLFENFFVGKATEHLIGEGVLPECQPRRYSNHDFRTTKTLRESSQEFIGC